MVHSQKSLGKSPTANLKSTAVELPTEDCTVYVPGIV